MISGLFRLLTISASLHNTSYAKLNYCKKMAATFAFVAIALLGAGVALAQNASPAGGAAVATDAAKDAALKTYLQKHFKIPSAELVTLGPAFKTPIAGLLARQLTVKNDQGQSITAMIFFDKNEDKAIIGQFLDLGAEPWGRVNMGAVTLDDRPTQGPADAPVTIVEFADFECPFCAHAFSVIGRWSIQPTRAR